MAFEHNIKKEDFEKALTDIGNDIWTGFVDSKKSIGYLVTDEGDTAQIQIIATKYKEEWLEDDSNIPEYVG